MLGDGAVHFADLPSLRTFTVALDIPPACPEAVRALPVGLRRLELANTWLQALPRQLANLTGARAVTLCSIVSPFIVRVAGPAAQPLHAHAAMGPPPAGLTAIRLDRCAVETDPSPLLFSLRHLAEVCLVSPPRPLALDADFGLRPSSSGHASPVHRLALVDCGLRAVPRGVTTLSMLTALDASHNTELGADPAACLPHGLAALSALAELRLAHCGLGAVPPAVWELPHLTRLDLSGNPFTTVPRSAPASADGLAVLNLSGTRLRSMPSWLAAACALRELSVSAAALVGGLVACGASGGGPRPACVGGGTGSMADVAARLSPLAIADVGSVEDGGGWLPPLLAQLHGRRVFRVAGATWEAAAVKALMSLLTARGGCGGLRIEIVP